MSQANANVQARAQEIVAAFKAGAATDVRLWVNGKEHLVPCPPPETTLLEYLRGQGLTGTKLGCGEVRDESNARPTYSP